MNTCLSSNIGNNLQLKKVKITNIHVHVNGSLMHVIKCTCKGMQAYLEELDVGGVMRVNKETLQVWLKHTLKGEQIKQHVCMIIESTRQYVEWFKERFTLHG